MATGIPDSGVLTARTDAVAVVHIDRPQQRNSLTDEVLAQLTADLTRLDDDASVRCIVVAGSAKVFASGADIRALQQRSALDLYDGDRSHCWAQLRAIRTPLVAAVSGFCLGGGCELAMYADVIVASPTARFGLPETQLGLIPGAGGTQLLPRAIGRAIAADMILTGRLLSADEALQMGLISRVAADGAWLQDACAIGREIARRPAVAQRLAKEALNAAYETGLQAGIGVERRSFAMAFASDDAREGLSAFVEKRDPDFRHT